jgi:hypothetical protein
MNPATPVRQTNSTSINEPVDSNPALRVVLLHESPELWGRSTNN